MLNDFNFYLTITDLIFVKDIGSSDITTGLNKGDEHILRKINSNARISFENVRD